MALRVFKIALMVPLRFFFGLFTRNKHLRYALIAGESKKRIEDTLRLKNAYEHIESTCRLFRASAYSNTKTIVDVGGGSGNTMRLFRQYFPELHIHVFEPIPSNMDLIKKKNTSNITLHSCALGSEEGNTSLYLTSNITSSSLLKPTGPEAYGEELRGTGELQIEVKRLDAILPPDCEIGILKMDVQGFEKNVLMGCGSLLRQTDFIVMEVNNHNAYSGAPAYYELDGYMRENGFKLAGIFPGRVLSDRLLDWDAIYERDARGTHS